MFYAYGYVFGAFRRLEVESVEYATTTDELSCVVVVNEHGMVMWERAGGIDGEVRTLEALIANGETPPPAIIKSAGMTVKPVDENKEARDRLGLSREQLRDVLKAKVEIATMQYDPRRKI